ncbi:MAG: M56 family metallopeptidase [Chthoniobacteraceae bacterium]
MNPLGFLERLTQWLAHTSWEAAWIVLAILLVRFCFRKSLPASWRYALWLLVVARLLLPALPQMPLRTKGFAMERGVTPVWAERWVASALDTDAVTPPAALPLPQMQSARAQILTVSMKQGLALLWLLGATGFGAVALLQVRRFGRAVRRAPECENAAVLACAQAAAEQMGTLQRVRQRMRILETPHVSAPAMMGLLRPVLLLPEGLPQRFSPEELRMVFLHEFAHLRRKDLWLNPLLLGLQIVHWFNPVLWFAFRQMRQDRELACDALVLEQDRIGLKRLYGETLLRLLEDFSPRPGTILPSVSMMESNRHLKERLTRIMQATAGASHAWKLGLALFLALGITTLTRSAISSEKTANEPQQTPPANVLSGTAAVQPQSSPSPGENTPAKPPVKPIQERVRERFKQDRQTYTPEQLKEIEELYQTANKQWQSPEAKAALKVLIEKYPKANRTGCAILYLGQMTSGPDREAYLKEAIQNHSDCFYGDGVQVGAYARLHLADIYLKSGKTAEGKVLLEQIRKDYPDAVAHDGRPVAVSIERMLNPPVITPQQTKNVERAKERFAKDRKTYTPEQFKELESLYQMANKELGSPGAKDVLKLVIEKYPQSNRAGCALMYLAQRSQGQEQESYLKAAIENHSDCFYGDGVQVGAYARFYLAGYYLKSGKTDEAKALQEQIRKDYPDAINHDGKPLMSQSN